MSEPTAAGEALQPTVVVTPQEIQDAKHLLESAGITVTTPEEAAAAQAAAELVDRDAFIASSIEYHEREASVLQDRRAALEGKLVSDQEALDSTRDAIVALDAEIAKSQDAVTALRSEGGV